MLALLFYFLLALVFVVLLYRGIRSGEVLAKGWFHKTQLISREDRPFMYWLTCAYYLICVICALGLMVSVFSSRPGS